MPNESAHSPLLTALLTNEAERSNFLQTDFQSIALCTDSDEQLSTSLGKDIHSYSTLQADML